MRYVSVSFGTDTNKHPKSTAVNDVGEAYRLVRCQDPEELNYVIVTIHLVKEDLHPEAFSALVKDVLQTDKPAASWGDRAQQVEQHPLHRALSQSSIRAW